MVNMSSEETSVGFTVSKDDGSGFGAISRGVEELTSSAQKQVGMAKSDNQSTLKLKYNMAFQLEAEIEGDWEVVQGFTLSTIGLVLKAQVSDNEDAAIQIMLYATGKIGSVYYVVTAEIPHLSKETPLQIVFRLALRSQASPDDLWSSVQDISGDGNKKTPSMMVPDNLRNSPQTKTLAADLTLAFIKPVGQSFSFQYFLLSFGGDINWSPKIEYPKVTVVGGSLSFALIKRQQRKGISRYDAMVELQGKMIIEGVSLNVHAGFTRVDEIVKAKLSVWNTAPSAAKMEQRISADTFYSKISSKGSLDEDSNIGGVSKLVDLPSGSYLDVMNYDLATPNIQFALSVDFSSKGLDSLIFRAYAREISQIEAEWLKGYTIRDLAINVDLNNLEKERTAFISGILEVGNWRFLASLGYEKRGNASKLVLEADLEQVSGDFSIMKLAADPVFNSEQLNIQENTQEGFNQNVPTRSELEEYVGSHAVHDDSALSLKEATSRAPPAQISFELILSTEVKDANDSSKKATEEKTVTDTDNVKNGKSLTTRDEKKDVSNYKIESARLQAHYSASWTLITDHIVLEEMGVAFNMENPSTKQKIISGYVYGEWTIENYVLWTYILGQSKQDQSSLAIGLTIKNKRKDSVNDTLASILADPKLADGVGMPTLDLHKDIKSNPEAEKANTGLNLDGQLTVKLLKKKEGAEEKPKWRLQEVMARLAIDSDFVLFGERALAKAFVQVKITEPMDKTKRAFDCVFLGYLAVEEWQVLLSSVIRIRSDGKKIEEKPTDKTKALEEAKKQDLDAVQTPSAVEDKEDLRFHASISKNTNPKPISVDEIMKSLTPTQKIDPAQDKNYVPPDMGISVDSFSKSLDFQIDIHVGKKESSDKRSIKSLVLQVSASGSWDIVPDVLVLRDAGLKLFIMESETETTNKKRFMAHGTLSFLKIDAQLTAAIFYENGTTSFGLVAEIGLTKLLGGLTNKDEIPDLLTEHEEKTKTAIIASVVGTVKDKKLDSFTVLIRSVGQILIADTFAIDEIVIGFNKKAEKSEKTLYLQGRLTWGDNEADKKSISAAATFTKKKITFTVALNKAPGKMLDDFLGKDAPSNSGRPELPDVTGFNDWNDPNFDVTKYQKLSGGAESKTTFSGQVVFEQLEGSTSRKFTSVALILTQAKDKKWELISGWFWFTDFEFQLSYNVVKKVLAVQLETRLNFKRRKGSSDTGADSEGHVNDSLVLTLTATKEELALTIPFHKVKDCNVTDLIYCISGGTLDVPHDIGIPMFPKIQATLTWKQKKAVVEGHLSEDGGKSWEFNKIFGSILRMKDPMLEARLSWGSGSKQGGSIKGTAEVLSTLDVPVEFVLPKGPLLVFGLDVKKIADMVKKIWEWAKKLYEAGKKLYELGKAIGSFVSGVAAVGEGLLDVAGVVVGFLAGVIGGLLGGAAWDKLKDEAVKALKDLFTDEKDKKEIEDGFRNGTKEQEKQDVADIDPKDNHNNPDKPIKHHDGPPPSEGLEIRGTGSASGISGEPVELIVIPRIKGGSRTKIEVSFFVDGKPVSTTRNVYSGYAVRCAYRRPISSAYRVKVTAKPAGTATDTMAKELQLATYDTRVQVIADQTSRLILPSNITGGVPFSATLVLADKHGNVIDGYDDRNSLTMLIDGTVSTTAKVWSRRDGYILNIPALSDGSHTLTFRSSDGRYLLTQTTTAATVFDPATSMAFGSGVSGGPMDSKAEFFVRALDYSGVAMSSANVSIYLVTTDDLMTKIPATFDAASKLYRAEYTRPSKFGTYKLLITIDGQPMPSTPLTLMAHDFIDVNRTMVSVRDDTPTSKTQTVVIQAVDFYNSRWRAAAPALETAHLVCVREGQPPKIYGNLVSNQDGTYSMEIKLRRGLTYTLRLETMDGRKSQDVQVTLVDHTLAKTVFASGLGLQTGNEGSTAVIDLFAFDAEEKSVIIDSSKVKAFATVMAADGKGSPIECAIEDSKIYYTRPPARNSQETAQDADAVDVYIRIFYGATEAYGSPFHVKSVPHFRDVVPDHCKLSQLPSRSSKEGLEVKRAALVLVDNYGTMMTAETEVIVDKVNDGVLLGTKYLPSGVYEVEYDGGGNPVVFDVVVNGELLDRPPMATATFSLLSPEQAELADPMDIRFQSSERVASRNIEGVLFPTASSDKDQVFFTASAEIDADGTKLWFNRFATGKRAMLRPTWYSFKVTHNYLPIKAKGSTATNATSEYFWVRQSIAGASPNPPPAIVLVEEDVDS